MAGRHRRRRSTSKAPAKPSPSSPSSSSREVAIVPKSAEKMSNPPVSTTPSSSTMVLPQGWADLPDDLLHLIISLLRFPHEALAFAATCRPWYSAILSCLSVINFFAFFPPVLLQPKLLPDNNVYSEFFVDPTTNAASVQCWVPWRIVNKMDYIGYSYGNIIYVYKKKCHLFDVFTGAMTESPRLITEDKGDYPTFGALTAPIASPVSSVLVQAGSSMFHWKVGTASWFKLCRIDQPFDQYMLSGPERPQPIFQVIYFKDEIFAIDYELNLFRVFLEPVFRLQKLSVGWAAAKFDGYMWFVVCDEMLLLVGPADNRYQAVHLDFSSRRKRMVKVDRMDNWAMFVGGGTKSQAFGCKNPERWGGRSNCIYLCGGVDAPWSVVQLGDAVKEQQDHLETRYWWPTLRHIEGGVADLPPIWVFPGVFYRTRRG